MADEGTAFEAADGTGRVRRGVLVSALLVALCFLSTILSVGHGVAPAVLLLLPGRFLHVTVLIWVGLASLVLGVRRVPSSSGHGWAWSGVLALAVAEALLLWTVTDAPALTARTAVPFAVTAVWFLREAHRPDRRP